MISQIYAMLELYQNIKSTSDAAQQQEMAIEERKLIVLLVKAGVKYLTDYLAGE